VKRTEREKAVRRTRDEDPLEEPQGDDDVELSWGYENPVRHRPPPVREAKP
jgi:hypothetical protein